MIEAKVAHWTLKYTFPPTSICLYHHNILWYGINHPNLLQKETDSEVTYIADCPSHLSQETISRQVRVNDMFVIHMGKSNGIYFTPLNIVLPINFWTIKSLETFLAPPQTWIIISRKLPGNLFIEVSPQVIWVISQVLRL